MATSRWWVRFPQNGGILMKSYENVILGYANIKEILRECSILYFCTFKCSINVLKQVVSNNVWKNAREMSN